MKWHWGWLLVSLSIWQVTSTLLRHHKEFFVYLPFLLRDLRDDALSDGSSSFTNRKSQSFVHWDVSYEVTGGRDVFSRHGHWSSLWQGYRSCNVGSTEKELWLVVGLEGGVTTTCWWRGETVSWYQCNPSNRWLKMRLAMVYRLHTFILL